MRNGAVKSGICLVLTAMVAVCGANEAGSTPFRLDRLAFERIHHPTERQASLGWMARLSAMPGQAGAADTGSGRYASWLAHKTMSRGIDSWRLARLGPLTRGWDGPAKADDGARLVRLRPITRISKGRVGSIDEDFFVATPGGRAISDAYDFAGVDPKGYAPITPVKMKRMPVKMKRTPVETARKSAEKNRAGRQRLPKPTSRNVRPPGDPNEVLDLSVRTLDYVVLTTKAFVENLSQILKNFL